MKRRILRIPVLLTLSLLLLFAVIVLWIRSPRRADLLMFYTPAGHLTGLASDETGLLLAATDVPFGQRFALSADVLTGTRNQFAGSIHNPLFNPAYEKWHLLGFRCARGTFKPTGWTFCALIVPYWALVIPLLILPLTVLRRMIVRRRRRRRGRCADCGCDMRHSPDRCPKCGRAAADAQNAPAGMVWARLASWSLLVLMIAVAVRAIVRGRRAALTEVPEPKTVLDRRIAEVALDNVSLEAAVDRLGKLGGAPIEMTQAVASTAADYRVPLILPLHLRVRNISVATSLRLLADASSVRNLDLTYMPRPDGGILLQERSAAERILRSYDLGNLPYQMDSSDFFAPIGAALRPSVADSGPFRDPGDSRLIQIGGRLVVFATWREQAQIAAALRTLRGTDAESEASAAILSAIDKKVGPIEVRDMPLADVIDLLGRQAGINLVVNWSSFAPDQHLARRGRPITTRVARLPLRAALDNLFRGPREPIQLSYAVDDNVLIISTAPVSR